MSQLLLLSNSTMPGEQYFRWPLDYVRDFLGTKKRKLLFIPYAGVTISYDEYFHSIYNIFESLNCSLTGIHEADNKREAIEESEGIVVGGGNTFQLLNKLYEFNLIQPLKEKISSGSPYIGWSAGSNIACPTLQTTNDMPIVQPPSFHALGLVTFQINAHYTEAVIPNHGGESRNMRLTEYIEINRQSRVVGLPEGDLLEINGNTIILKGRRPAKLFEYGKEPVELLPGENISRFLNK